MLEAAGKEQGLGFEPMYSTSNQNTALPSMAAFRSGRGFKVCMKEEMRYVTLERVIHTLILISLVISLLQLDSSAFSGSVITRTNYKSHCGCDRGTKPEMNKQHD